ncbi:hypothetical protein ABE65_005905 [Fictibacillus phosphorivorans]|uniref:Uncharacterized protein n=1 Tax=Fictibacillus phosphorivorans TaxID=1221500 RepID=A0A160ILT8_9BACL|nr:hypothetical protein [Fictibacillus phosphorivorans]ANC76362.1 hypothetical protein ABE65_005905 [Fictibacillus phosphorivorans]
MKVFISNLLLGILFGLIVGSAYNQQGICIMLGGILGVFISIYLQLYGIQRYLSKRSINHPEKI